MFLKNGFLFGIHNFNQEKRDVYKLGCASLRIVWAMWKNLCVCFDNKTVFFGYMGVIRVLLTLHYILMMKFIILIKTSANMNFDIISFIILYS